MAQSLTERLRLRRERAPSVVALFPMTVRGILGFLAALITHMAAFTFYTTNKALLAAAFITGVIVGLSEGFFRSAVQPPLVAIGERLSATKTPRPAPLVGPDEALPLAPTRLFGEAYRGSELEQRGTEAHEADDLVGSGPLPEHIGHCTESAGAPGTQTTKPARALVEEQQTREAEYAAAMAGFVETERIIHTPPGPAPAPTSAAPSHPSLEEIKETMAKAKEEEETFVEYVPEEKPAPRPARPLVVAGALKEAPPTLHEREDAIPSKYEPEGHFHGAEAALEAMGHKEEAAVHAVPPPAAAEEEHVETPKQPPGWVTVHAKVEKERPGVEETGETEALMGGAGPRCSEHPSPGPSPPRAGEVPRVVAVTLCRRPEVARAAAATAEKEKKKESEKGAAVMGEGGPGYTASQITAAPEILLPEGEVAYGEDEGGAEGVQTPAARAVPAPVTKPVAPPAPVRVDTEGAAQPVSAPITAPAPVEEPSKKKKKPKHGGRGPIGGPLHKLAKEIKKAVTPS